MVVRQAPGTGNIYYYTHGGRGWNFVFFHLKEEITKLVLRRKRTRKRPRCIRARTPKITNVQQQQKMNI
ncbi:hypothetical protein OUZ56_028249 [Daphnia magna]|uniref:Uncharacterized protein n=1 Tax=Daphnia magna TaxID=35525 RepID=A0ABR0B3A1_9CRUS|nr:hypothetical protein OUZ56_028249 [Daphnia magna]